MINDRTFSKVNSIFGHASQPVHEASRRVCSSSPISLVAISFVSPAKTVRNHGEFQNHTLGGACRAPDEVASAPGLLVPRARWSKLARRSLRPGACVCAVLQPLKDLLHPTAADLKQTHKLKRLVQAPNSFFMDVRCNQCISMYVPAWCACQFRRRVLRGLAVCARARVGH